MIRLETFLDAPPGAPYCSIVHVGSAQVFFLTPDELRQLSQLVGGALDKLDARRVAPPRAELTPAQKVLAKALKRGSRR